MTSHLGLPSSSHSAANGSTYLQKNSVIQRTFCGKWPKILTFFSTAMVFLSWKLPGSSTHTTVSQTAASQISLYTWSQCKQRTFWYCMTALAILHNVKFFANTIYVGLQVFMGATIPLPEIRGHRIEFTVTRSVHVKLKINGRHWALVFNAKIWSSSLRNTRCQRLKANFNLL